MHYLKIKQRCSTRILFETVIAHVSEITQAYLTEHILKYKFKYGNQDKKKKHCTVKIKWIKSTLYKSFYHKITSQVFIF